MKKEILTPIRNFSLRHRCWPVLLLPLLFLLIPVAGFSQNCSVNAGVPETICPDEELFLFGNKTGLFSGAGTITWSQVSGPSATIVSPNDLTTEVINLIPGSVYVFRISTRCQDGSLVFQDVTKTVLFASQAEIFTPGFTACPGTNVGTLTANAPGANETGVWSLPAGSNGVSIDNPNDPNTTLTFAEGACGETTVRWTITNDNGCSTFADVVVINRGGVTPVSAGDNQTLSHCYSTTQSSTLNGSFAGCSDYGQQGTWTVISGPNVPNITNPNSNSTNISNLIEGTYRLRWTVTGACASGFDEVDIIVPAPTADITDANAGSNQTFCDGRTSTVLNGNAPIYINETVLWTQISGPSGATIENPNLPVTEVTGLDGSSTYVFSYTINNSVTDCSSSDNITISYFTDVPTLEIDDDVVIVPCNETTASISFTEGGSGNTQYRILNGPAGAFGSYPTSWANAGASPASVSGLTKRGEYDFQFRRTTPPGVDCGTAFDEVTVIISITDINLISNAGTPQILDCGVTATDLAGNDPTDVGLTPSCGTWSQVGGPSQVTLADPNDPSLGISGLLTGTYTFRWCLSGGPACDPSSDEVTVLVANTQPTLQSAGPDQTVCSNSPVYLDADPPQFIFENAKWSVDPDAGVIISDINDPKAVVTGLQPFVTYTFSWTISNGCGAITDTMTVEVNDDEGPIPADAGDDQCIAIPAVGTASATLSGNDPEDGTGTWSFLSIPIGATTPTFSPNANTPDAIITGLVSGTYTLEWMIETVEGCEPTRDEVTITVSDISVANAGFDIEVCGTQTTLTGNEPGPGETGLWTQVAGPAGPSITSPTFSTTTVTNLGSFVYTFRWTISDGACSDDDDVRVFVTNDAPSTASITLADDVCGQTTNTLQAEEPTQGSGTWSLVSGPNTPSFTSPNSHETEITGLITGDYVVRWTVSGGNFCEPSVATASFTVTREADAGADQEYCEEITAVNLTGTVASIGTWTVTAVPVGSNTPTITPTSGNTAVASGLAHGSDPEKGTYVFRYTITANNCESSDEMEVTLWQPPSLAAAGDDQLLCDENNFFMDATPPDFGTGTWSVLYQDNPGGSFDNPNFATTTFSGANYGVHVFQWTVANGDCDNADQVRFENFAEPSPSDAGPPQELVCATEITMAGNDPAIGVGTWTLTAQSPTTPDPVIVSPILYNTPITGLGPQSNGDPGVYTF